MVKVAVEMVEVVEHIQHLEIVTLVVEAVVLEVPTLVVMVEVE